tara:strand:- start:1794 stop:2642 length:849 start_codon:yes stop_codon:yes gene_type:complete
MEGKNSQLLTIIFVAFIAIVVLWLLLSLDKNDVCYGAVPDPVGNVLAENVGPGEVKISWDPTPNATKYRVYLNTCPEEVTASRKKCTAGNKVGACGQSCCPDTACTACVSQSNYKKLIETDATSVIIETCEPCLCYIIVPYNHCGQAGQCKEVRTVNIECMVDDIQAWIVQDNCLGTNIQWLKPKCCDTIHIYVDGQLFESVDAALQMIKLETIPEELEIAIQCETSCGLGELNILRAAAVTASKKSSYKSEVKYGSRKHSRYNSRQKNKLKATVGVRRYKM